MKALTPGEKRIAKRYKSYKQSIMTTWESYKFLNFSLEYIDKRIKDNDFPIFELEHLSNIKTGKDHSGKFNKNSILGVVDHLTKIVTPERALLEPVAYTESYLQDICEIVYKDFPEKILGKNPNNNVESDKQQMKLLNLIINSEDKDEMLDKIIEEKIRGIFYGNPMDFYEKDKANIGIGDYFKSNHRAAQQLLAEIIARRNIYIHNEGRVDSKYLREVKKPLFDFDKKALLDENYIREAIIILRGFAVTVTNLKNS